MEQATQPTTPTASAEDRQDSTPVPGTFAHAAAVAARVVTGLQQKPTAVEISEDFPSGYRVHLKYRGDGSRIAGLYEFAASFDIPITKAITEFGLHLDALTRFETLELHCSALTTEGVIEALEEARRPDTKPDAQAATAVPLGASALAVVPAVVSASGDSDDVPRCVRCGCTEDAACEGGCYWVPNRQLVDLCSACATPEELQAMTYTAEISDGAQ